MQVTKWLFSHHSARRAVRSGLLKITMSDADCVHNKQCLCDMHVELRLIVDGDVDWSATFKRYNPSLRSNFQMYQELAANLEARYFIGPHGLVSRSHVDKDVYLKLGISNSQNMFLASAPFNYSTDPDSAPEVKFDPKIIVSVKAADYQFLLDSMLPVSADFLEKNVFLPSSTFPNPKFQEKRIPSLFVLAARKAVQYNRIFGDTNGRPHFRHALQGLTEDQKLENTILLMDRPVKDVTPLQRSVLEYTEEAMDRMHQMNDTAKYIGTVDAKFNPCSLKDVQLGASNGLYPGQVVKIKYDGLTYTISDKGKKYENFEAVMKKLLRCIDTRTDIQVFWAIVPKHEMKFSFTAQLNQDEYDKWIKKHRIFLIPSSIFIFAERMLIYARKIFESSTRIKVGHKWPRGGADYLFRGLKIDGVSFGDGDFSKYDQSIHSILMNIFYSSMLIYYKREGPNRAAMEWLCDQLAKNCVVRLTHMLRGHWAFVVGGLPSGAFSTSHAGSWIVLFLYCLFLSTVVRDLCSAGKDDLAAEIERMIMEALIWIITYGDDHNTAAPDEVYDLVGEKAFADWLETIWDMQIRDRRDRVPLLSLVRNGEMVSKGLIFLKHYFIKCTFDIPNPPKMVPFRPTSDLVMKAVISRNATIRNVPDSVLSTVGVIYGTMGVNEFAYKWLRNYYHALLVHMEGGIDNPIYRKLVLGVDLRRLRQFGMDASTFSRPFPELRDLQLMNSVDLGYHSVSRDIEEEHVFLD